MLSRPSASCAPYICARCLLRHQRPRKHVAAAAELQRRHYQATTPATPASPNTRPRCQKHRQLAPISSTTPAALFSTSSAALSNPAAAAPPLPAAAGITALPHRRLIALSGPDAPKFLQGLTTNNVAPDARRGWYTAFLNAQGRVLYDAFVYPTSGSVVAAGGAVGPGGGASGGSADEWACFIEADASCVDGLFKLLRRHKLRSKVGIRRVEEGEWGVWSAWAGGGGGGAPGAGGEELEGIALTTDGGAGGSTAIHLHDARIPGFGHRLLLPLTPAFVSSSAASGITLTTSDEAASAAAALSPALSPVPPNLPPPFADLPPVSPRAYAVRRYLAGLPEGPRELRPAEALPLESNVDLMRGVDFRKGCYVGQELTIRTKHTGVVRKRVLPVRLYDLGEGSAGEPGALEFAEGGVGGVRAEDVPVEAGDIRKVADGGGEDGEGGEGAAPPPAATPAPRRNRNANRSAGKWLAGVGNVGLALCRLEMMTDVKVVAEGMGSSGGGYKPGMRFGLKWSVDGEGGGEKSVGVKAFVPEWHRVRIEEDAKSKKRKPQAVEED